MAAAIGGPERARFQDNRFPFTVKVMKTGSSLKWFPISVYFTQEEVQTSAVTIPPALRPRKNLGQNFLRDLNIARKIAGAIAPAADDNMLEIGPGEGVLTLLLAPHVHRLVAVELDGRAIPHLRTVLAGLPAEVVEGDILDLRFAPLAGNKGRLRVVGNIPYNITSPILFHILDQRADVVDATLMMQREVAHRLAAPHGNKEYGILSVFCQLYADVNVLFDVSPNVFFPKPEVTSSLVQLNMLPAPRYSVVDEPFFRAMVRAVFGKRRKTLRASLRYFLPELPPTTLPVDLQRRPENLSIEELVLLANALAPAPGEAQPA
jgi:16S rRNA (adenine1518-N6/adenine1519-N6)-dimethyltransferase